MEGGQVNFIHKSSATRSRGTHSGPIRRRHQPPHNDHKLNPGTHGLKPYSRPVEQSARPINHRNDQSLDDVAPTPGRSKRETNEHRLAQRQKQIDFGKNTLGYDVYSQSVQRDLRGSEDPVTPDKTRQMSTRAWAGLIKKWRRLLHKWDPAGSDPTSDDVKRAVSPSQGIAPAIVNPKHVNTEENLLNGMIAELDEFNSEDINSDFEDMDDDLIEQIERELQGK